MILRCMITGNPVGTDTQMVGHPCRCQVCNAATEIARLTAERDEWQAKWLALAQAAMIMGGTDEQTAQTEK